MITIQDNGGGYTSVQNIRTWRELLGKIIKDPQDKQRLAITLAVNPGTLGRWINGESTPRPNTLRLLVEALPAYSEQLLELMALEFGGDVMKEVGVDTAALEIPSAFYAHIMSLYATSQRPTRFISLVDAILQQGVQQLDPHRRGMELTVVQCMSPGCDGKVYSLHEKLGRGTRPWQRDLEQRACFLGIEALAGYVVSTGRQLAMQRGIDDGALFPAKWMEGEESAMAYPIMLADRIAGCLLASSTQRNYFLSQIAQRLIKEYAQLLSLAFPEEEFYALSSIHLGKMPSYEVQTERISHFRLRVSTLMREGWQGGRVGLIKAEQLVWQQIEQELLEYAMLHENDVTENHAR